MIILLRKNSEAKAGSLHHTKHVLFWGVFWFWGAFCMISNEPVSHLQLYKSNNSVFGLRQVPDRNPQSACRNLPQSGHTAPWSFAGSLASRLPQWWLGSQGQHFSFSLFTSPVCTVPGFRWQRWTTGPAEPLRQQKEVRRTFKRLFYYRQSGRTLNYK